MISKRAPSKLIVDETTPGRLLTIADLTIGDCVEQSFVFTARHRDAFAKVANDRAPVHEDDRFAHAHGFQGTIIQGLCVSTRFSRLIGMYLPGEHAILETISLKYRLPTYEGMLLHYSAEISRLLPSLRVARLALSVRSSAGTHVLGEAQCLVR